MPCARTPGVLRPAAGRPRRQRTRVRGLPHGDRQLPVVTGHRRSEIPAAAVAAPVQSAAPTIRCFARSMPTTSGSTARTRTTSATCVRTGSCGSRSRLPPNIRLIDPVTDLPSAETFVDVWRSVPTVNDVALTGPDDGQSVVPRSERVRWLPARCASGDAAGAGAGGLHQSRPGSRTPRRTQLLDDLASFQRVLFTNHRVRALADALSPTARLPLPDADPSAQRARTGGKAVFERACAQCHGGPGQSTAQAAGRPLSRHLQPVSASGRHGDAGAIRLRRRVRRSSRAMRGPTRSRCPTAPRSAATSSDPGRALLTGFVGGPPAQDDWNKFDMPGLRGHQPDRAVLPQQQRRDARGDGRPLHRVLQAGQATRRPAAFRPSSPPTACTSIDRRRRKSALRCWPI